MTTNRNKVLGRGLEALFSDVKGSESSVNEILNIDINKITPNENQPRKTFENDKIEELAQSIKNHGMIQPIVVKKIESGYEIVAGERRWRASRKAELKEIPCIVKELDEKTHMLIALIENMQRENLNAIEEAVAFERMAEKFKLTQDEISKSVGKSRPYITNTLRLLKLPEEIKNFVLSGELSSGHGRALVGIDDKKKQLELAKMIIEKGLSVRQTEMLADSIEKSNGSKQKRVKETSAELVRIENDIKSILGTKVTISQGKKRGKIEIEYYSHDELERLIEILMSIK